jgi:hypothetical protein
LLVKEESYLRMIFENYIKQLENFFHNKIKDFVEDKEN